MKDLILISCEGVVLLRKSINRLQQLSDEQVSRFAKYFVLSRSIWDENVYTQTIKHDLLNAHIIRRSVEGRELFFCAVDFFSLTSPCDYTMSHLADNVEAMTRLALFKISNIFVRKYCKELAITLELISTELKKAMDNGTFSDSVGGVGYFSDVLDSCDEFQDMKLLIEQAQIEFCLSDPRLHMSSLVDGIHSLQNAQVYISSIKCSDKLVPNVFYNLFTCSDVRVLKALTEKTQCEVNFQRAEIVHNLTAKLSQGSYLIRVLKGQFSIDMVVSSQFEIDSLQTLEAAFDTSLTGALESFMLSLETELL